jgi:hypothetical protein
MTQAIVWTRQPWVSWMWRAFHRTMGATIHAQMNCPTMVAHLR